MKKNHIFGQTKKMKKIIFFTAIILSTIISFAQTPKEIKVKSSIKSATVYLNNAEIIRSQNLNIPKGRVLLVFEGLSPKILDNSVRVTSNKDIDILQITTVRNFLKKEKASEHIKILKDSLADILTKIKDLEDIKSAYETEKQVLDKNNSIGGQNNGVSIDELKATADFYLQRSLEINKKITELNRKIQKFQTSKVRIQNQLSELNANSNYIRKKILILIENSAPVTANITLKYIVADAGWSPTYDIKAEDTDKPIKFVYRANVFNNTEIDWKNIKLTLSTYDATAGNIQPQLETWFINEQQQQISYRKGGGYYQKSQAQNDYLNNIAAQEQMEYDKKEIISETTPPEIETVVPIMSYEFEIQKKYTIPADDKPYIVSINEVDLNADYQLFTVPKIDKDVFLIARITNWQDLNLIDGPANIYYAGSYIGKSFIYVAEVSDTLDVSLGRDSKVIVKRTKLNQLSSTQFIGNKKKVTFAYQYEIKNNHNSTVHLELRDQIPISQNSDIEVKVEELSGGQLNVSTGIITWDFDLAPGDSKKFNFIFTVKFPKNKHVPLIQNSNQNQRIRYFR